MILKSLELFIVFVVENGKMVLFGERYFDFKVLVLKIKSTKIAIKK